MQHSKAPKLYSWLLASIEKSPLQFSKVTCSASCGTGHCRRSHRAPQSSPLAKKDATRPKQPPKFGACAEQPAAIQEPGGVSFTEVTVWKTLGQGSAGLTSEEKPNKLLPSPLQHISGLNHTFRSSRRFRSRPSLPVSLGSAAAGFFVRCSWFRRAPGERTRDSPARLPRKATLRLGDVTELHVPRGLFRRGPGGLGLQLSRPAPRGPCPGALRVVAAAFAFGLLTLSQGFPHPRMFCVRRPHSSLLRGLSCLPLTRVVEGVRSSLFLGLCPSEDALPGQSQLQPARLLLAGARARGPPPYAHFCQA